MGVSTNGQISYGIKFDEDFEFPWSSTIDGEETEWNGDEENWWLRKVMAWKPSVPVYDEDGEYLPGFDEHSPEVDTYFDEKFAFEKEHPMPVALVNYCSGDYPMYILALPSKCLSNNRGFPETFDPASLTVTDAERQILIDFCKTHGIDTNGEEPKWWLSSYWG